MMTVQTESNFRSRVSRFSEMSAPVTAEVFIHCARRYTRSSKYRVSPVSTPFFDRQALQRLSVTAGSRQGQSMCTCQMITVNVAAVKSEGA